MPRAPAAVPASWLLLLLQQLPVIAAVVAISCFSLVCLLFSSLADATSIGAVYGRNGNNIPTPQQAAQLMHKNVLTRVRIYDYDATVIQAFSLTQIRVIIGVPNDEIPGIAGSQQLANSWILDNVAAYIKTTNINAIAVGSDVPTTASNISSYLVPAMWNLYNGLATFSLNLSVKVSSPMNLEILEISYPPSAGVFYSSLVPLLQPMLAFLAATDSFFMLNVYPFLSYEYNPNSIPLNYAIFNFPSGVLDTGSNLTYYSLYDAQVDALISAVSALNYSSLTVMITETGWPSAGASSEPAANYDNANAYLSNLVRATQTSAGTPLRPGQEIDAYIYDLYDEDLNSGQDSNQHFGLFYANGTSKYDIDFVTGTSGNGSPSGPVAGPGGSGSGGGNGSGSGGGNGSGSGGGNGSGSGGGSGSGSGGGSGSGSGGGSGSGSGGGSGSGSGGGSTSPPSSTLVWCVAKPDATNSSLQQGLNWACGPGLANCGPIQPGGACFLPDTVQSHASYAFNIHYYYFQTDPRSCIFGGDAELTNVDPSYGSCIYVASQATHLEGSPFTWCCWIIVTFVVATLVLLPLV